MCPSTWGREGVGYNKGLFFSFRDNNITLFTILIKLLKNKKHIASVVAGLLLFALAIPAFAVNSSPQIRCLAVDSVGDVTVTWVIPKDTSSATFKNYTLYYSTSKTGPFSNAVISSISQSSTTLNGLGANAAPYYFYILTDDIANGYSSAADTLETIFLNVLNMSGVARLMWNPIHKPNLPTSTGWYKIYREYPQYVWTLIDSTQSLIYLDTITICNAWLNYKVEIEDSSGCESVSNIAGGNFKNINAPPTPPMDTVSVNAANGVSITWYPASKNDVIGYLVYERINGVWKVIDTIYGINNTSYYYPNGNPDSASLQFCIAALDSCGNVGTLNNWQNTLFLMQAPDSCLQENYLTWNKYVSLIPGVKEYNLYVSVNGGPFFIMATTDANTVSFLQTGMNTVANYRYYIQVVDSNNPGITASSNIISYSVTVPPVPKFSYLQTATVVGGVSNAVNCYVDSTAECTDYTLQRADAAGAPYNTVATAGTNTQYVHFADPTADPNKQSYFYRVITQNQCGYNVDTSQLGQTIFLSAYGDATGVNTLTWNDYENWQNGVSKYYIFRNEDGGPFSMVAAASYTKAGTNIYKDDVSGVLSGQGIFSYYIVAYEVPSMYPFTDTSASNIAEAYQDPRVYIPNAFNPSPKGVNKVFIPIGVFENVSNYDFSVFDRLGQLLFETHNTAEGWDGRYGGHVCPEGVYVYHIVYTSSKGEYFDRKGTVTLLK